MVLKVEKKPASPIVNSSTDLLQPSIAKDEVDGNQISKGNGDKDAISITVAVGSPEASGNGEISQGDTRCVFGDNACHTDE